MCLSLSAIILTILSGASHYSILNTSPFRSVPSTANANTWARADYVLISVDCVSRSSAGGRS